MRLSADKIVPQAEIVSSRLLTAFLRLPVSWRGVGAIIIGVLLARWTWVLFAPHSLAVLPAKSDVDGRVTNSLFGIVTTSPVSIANTDAALGNVHLVGVFTGKRGFAVLKMDEKTQRGVALGEDVIKGTRLVAVNADHVLLEHNGVRQRVDLEIVAGSNKEGLAVEHPLAASGVKQAVSGWTQAQKEMQMQQDSSRIKDHQ